MTDTTSPPYDSLDRSNRLDIQQERRSYIDYAMSVIVGRAECARRLKPVHRRCSGAMLRFPASA